MAASPSTRSTATFKFQSSSLMYNTLFYADSGKVAFKLIGGYTCPTIAVDHGGLVGIKNTCVVRRTTFLVDMDGAEVAYVQWRGDVAVNVWVNGRTIVVPDLYSDPGEVTSLMGSQSGSVEEKLMAGVSEESVVFPWTLKESLEGTWTADEEGTVLLDTTGKQVALYTSSVGAETNGMLRLDVTGDAVIEAIATLLAMEGARRKAFNLGPLHPIAPDSPKSAKRRSIIKALKVYLKRAALRQNRSQSSETSGALWFSSSSRTSASSE
ncbi:unnamed protein product [Peniophora sp. CBMAI 1063]|nr:unnamed protein product [Peniophora sp. CBMAI 1063]